MVDLVFSVLAHPALWGLAFVAYLLAIALTCLDLLYRRRPAQATLAWLLALTMLPVVGALFYMLLGPRRLVRRRLRYLESRAAVRQAAQTHLQRTRVAVDFVAAGTSAHLTRTLDAVGQGRPVRAEAVDVYRTGDPCFAAIEEAIGRAAHHVHCEYYIWEPDTVGHRLRDALVARARDGVVVRVLVDAVGAGRLPRDFWAALTAAGGEVARFNPFRLSRLGLQSFNFRTHRKIVVVDGHVGFTGGINIHDPESAAASGELAWQDRHLRIVGEPVRKLQRLFFEDWRFALAAIRFDPRYFPACDPCDGPWTQIVASGPDDEAAAIQKAYFVVINAARERIWITTPYFVPDESVSSALVAAALRGVSVRILVPVAGDSWLVSAAARTYFDDVVAAGGEVFEYGPPMLHAKSMVVDGDIAFVGTANLDNRSFRLNFEVMAVVYDAGITESLARDFEADLARARRYQRPDGRRRRTRRVADRLKESVARLFSPVL